MLLSFQFNLDFTGLVWYLLQIALCIFYFLFMLIAWIIAYRNARKNKMPVRVSRSFAFTKAAFVVWFITLFCLTALPPKFFSHDTRQTMDELSFLYVFFMIVAQVFLTSYFLSVHKALLKAHRDGTLASLPKWTLRSRIDACLGFLKKYLTPKIFFLFVLLIGLVVVIGIVWLRYSNRDNYVRTLPAGKVHTISLFKPGYSLSQGWLVEKTSDKVESGTCDIILRDYEDRIELTCLEWTKESTFWDSRSLKDLVIRFTTPSLKKRNLEPVWNEEGNYFVLSKRGFKSKINTAEELTVTINFPDQDYIVLRNPQVILPKVVSLSLDIAPFRLSPQYRELIESKTSDPGALFPEAATLDLRIAIRVGGETVYSELLAHNYEFYTSTPPVHARFEALESDTIRIELEDVDFMFDDDITEWEGSIQTLIKNQEIVLPLVENFKYHAKSK